MTRRSFATLASATTMSAARRPNVILIITDDQGWPDLGCHGNPHLRTPNLDKLAGQSVEFTNFCVSPLCAPTRSSLMTGRYCYRTGVTDTYLGRALMDPKEVTVAEMLKPAGYATGLFGKWHLGDNAPLRPLDQGFDEMVMHNGGGIWQPSDPPGSGYFDPVFNQNGQWKQFAGYCTDVIFDEAIRFVEKHKTKPFFAYIATNAPHDPYVVPERYADYYRQKGVPERVAKIYGMIENIDENAGRLLKKLDEMKIAQDTIFIFMTDNGATNNHYTAGLRDLKSSVYEGGIRSPFFVRWPGRLRTPKKVATMAAHIDIAPTLLEACGATAPAGVKFDGRSLMPLMTQEKPAWAERTIFVQIHRGDEPELYRNCAARTQRWKLLHAGGRLAQPMPKTVAWELYDLENDPGETKNVAAQNPEVVAKLKAEYEAWFKDVGATRGFAPVRISLGSARENPVTLTRQDWRGPKASWDPTGLGYWEVNVEGKGSYSALAHFPATREATEVELRFGSLVRKQTVVAGTGAVRFDDLTLPLGPGRLELIVRSRTAERGVQSVDVRWWK